MTAKKDLKTRIRVRQAKTGETYTTARMHVLRAQGEKQRQNNTAPERLTAIVLKGNDKSLRVRVPRHDGEITLRTGSTDAWSIVPGQLIEATLTKRWTWSGNEYASGTIDRVWTDVDELRLQPLPLQDRGVEKLSDNHEPFRRPDPYAEMWEFFASTPRRTFEFDGIALGAGAGCGPDDLDGCLVADAAEISGDDPAAARELLMKALHADLRCIDAHAQLGTMEFEHFPKRALVHFDMAVRIGELSLPSKFDGMLLWGHLFNRPFLRALHGQGLCLWRLERTKDAREAFERLLRLNPLDNQGARFCWDDIRHERPWRADDVGLFNGNSSETIY